MNYQQSPPSRSMGIWSAASIGVGAMIGAGIFALVGIAVEIAGKTAYLAFFFAGAVALLTTYSVSRLAVIYPSKGGRVKFINMGFPGPVVSGGLNVTMWLGYIIVTSLYARAFGEYGVALFGLEKDSGWAILFSSMVVLLFVIINFTSPSVVGKSELAIVLVKVGILLLFGILGLGMIRGENLLPAGESSFSDIILAAGVVFMSYEGFGLVANTAEDLKDPRRNLPRALFLSVLVVMGLYLLVTVVVVGNLSIPQILRAKEYVLAQAAQPIMGSFGFTLMALAALFSTASAINATLYGPVHMLQETARAGQLPEILTRRLFHHQSGVALIVNGSIILVLSNLLGLKAIAETGSLIFLIIYTAVNVANLRLYRETGSKRWIIWTAIAGTLFSFAALFYYECRRGRASVFMLIGLVTLSFLYQWIHQKGIRAGDG